VESGVSAKDHVTTTKAAIAENALSDHIASPGHVFPLIAKMMASLKDVALQKAVWI